MVGSREKHGNRPAVCSNVAFNTQGDNVEVVDIMNNV